MNALAAAVLTALVGAWLVGWLPQSMVQLASRCYPPGDERRTEMCGEIVQVPFVERLPWAFQESRRALRDGPQARRALRRRRRLARRRVEFEQARLSARRNALTKHASRGDLRRLDRARRRLERAQRGQPVQVRTRVGTIPRQRGPGG